MFSPPSDISMFSIYVSEQTMVKKNLVESSAINPKQFKFLLSQFKFLLSQCKFLLSQFKFLLSQCKFLLLQRTFVLSRFEFLLSVQISGIKFGRKKPSREKQIWWPRLGKLSEHFVKI